MYVIVDYEKWDGKWGFGLGLVVDGECDGDLFDEEYVVEVLKGDLLDVFVVVEVDGYVGCDGWV